MAKITDFETPLGQKGNLFHPMSWIPLITGAAMFLFIISMGQKFGNAVGAKVPLFNTHPSQPFTPLPTPVATNNVEYIG